MVGYNFNNMKVFIDVISKYADIIVFDRTKNTASIYKILIDYDNTIGIEDEVFFVLFTLAFIDQKNSLLLSEKSPSFIYENSFSHKMNRVLYSQDTIARLIKRPSEMPAWIIYAMSKTGENDFISAVITMAIHKNKDIEMMMPSVEKMDFLMSRTSIFSKKQYITFKDISNACRDYTAKQI